MEFILGDKKSIELENLVKEEYRSYQLYTLMDRAIPYLQDGLKPGQRRILYTLWRNKQKGLMKVSSVTGLVLTLHPHGPASIESSLVNLAQDFTFSNNYPLIDKKGYFGERMETAPAAGRYIECQLGKVAEILLFEDMNQVAMALNYDERMEEPLGLLPKLPPMLLNGAEGIGTGFSCVIPSFHHKDLIKWLSAFLSSGKKTKLKPFFRHYSLRPDFDEKGKLHFPCAFKQKEGRIFITEIPRGFDAAKIYRHLNKLLEQDLLKDFIDSSVNNTILIELIFKKGQAPTSLEEIEKLFNTSTSLTPNYTLISDKGVRIFEHPEQILEIFAFKRLDVVKKRYQLWCSSLEERIAQGKELIRFIMEKEYAVATQSKNRKAFVEYLKLKDFRFFDYLADLPIYRMTKEEVAKRQDTIREDEKKLKEFSKIYRSDDLVKEKLLEELNDVGRQLDEWEKQRFQN